MKVEIDPPRLSLTVCLRLAAKPLLGEEIYYQSVLLKLVHLSALLESVIYFRFFELCLLCFSLEE